MKNPIRMLLIFAAVIIAFASCKKEASPANTGTRASGAAFFAASAPTIQRFTITAGQYARITGAKGTRLEFYPNSLLTSTGAPVTSGSVTVELQEMLTGPQMILAGKTTTSGGHLLISGGQMYLSVTQNGSALKPNPVSPPYMVIPTTRQGQPMQLFVGNAVVPPSGSDTVIDWTPDVAFTIWSISKKVRSISPFNLDVLFPDRDGLRELLHDPALDRQVKRRPSVIQVLSIIQNDLTIMRTEFDIV